MSGGRFFEVRVRVAEIDEAVALARRLDGEGLDDIAIDTGEGYGMRECAVEGCDAILYYPDEGEVCDEHSA